MGVEIFVTLVDWVSSIFVSVYNVVTHLGISLLGYLLIFFGIVFAVRIVKSFTGRLRLYCKLRKIFRTKEMSFTPHHLFFLSFIERLMPYDDADFSFTANGKKYYVKLFPGFAKGYRVLFEEGGTVILSRFLWKKKITLHFDYPMSDRSEAVLLFSPAPKGFFEPVRTPFGIDRFPLEGGRKYGDVIFFDQDAFLRQLDRILDGYVDSFYFENQKREDD